MQASEIVQSIEQAGGEFILDVPNGRFLYSLGQAPEGIVKDLRRERNEVARLLFGRQFLRWWEPGPEERIQ
jgi:hypothetical protein